MIIHLPHYITAWLHQYGSIAIFCLLALGVIALPVPDETLMIFSGLLIAQGKLHSLATLMAAYLGAICGISVSYLLGRTVGLYFLHKYGYWLGLSAAKIQKAHEWFERIGKWALFFGYFIPGIRHFTGYAAGITALEYRTFALFAYTGAITWSSLFLAIGYFLGNHLDIVFQYIKSLWLFALIIAVVIILFFYMKKFKNTK